MMSLMSVVNLSVFLFVVFLCVFVLLWVSVTVDVFAFLSRNGNEIEMFATWTWRRHRLISLSSMLQRRPSQMGKASVKIAYGFGILGFCFGPMDFFLEIFWIFPLDFLDFYRLVKEFF